MKTVLIETTAGDFSATFTKRGLARLEFPSNAAVRPKKKATGRTDREFANWEQLTRVALNDLLEGHEPAVLPPIDLTGTEFQRSVWNALSAIPIGQTKSYAEVAKAIGRPKATRAVGQACGANPIPMWIPCHRVLAANHKLGGFSGGLDWKEKLLAIEGGSKSLGPHE
ncbi:MAG: methylated-DNA--[protein]-cysteine S-methyltransferase [Verrucomicrobiales bacterium]|nr:methylated-DNA--[protein]-cysteine S-methyltransferase [Verrucomicrobiales bacterium]